MPDPMLMGEAFAAAAALALVITLLFGRSVRTGVRSAGTAAAVLAAVPAGLWVLDLLPHLPPREALDRLLLVVMPAAAGAEIVAAAAPRIGWAARFAVAALATPVLVHGSVYVSDLAGPESREWSVGTTRLVYAGSAVLLASVWAALNRLAVRTGGRSALWAASGVVLAAGVVTMLSGYASGGQLGVPLAAGLAGVALGSLGQVGKLTVAAALGVGVVGLFGLLVVGWLFAGLVPRDAALLFAAPLFGWLAEVLPPRRGIRPAMRLMFTAVPVVIAVHLAHQKFVADSARPGSSNEASLDDYMNFGK